MAKPRTCPHCFEVIPFGQGYLFDENDNLVCENCGKIAYPVVEPAPPPKLPKQHLAQYDQLHKEHYGPFQDPDLYQ